jgi:hypothetical protein
MKSVIVFLFFVFLFFDPLHAQITADQEAFYDRLKSLCEASHPGEVIRPEEPPRGFTDPLVAHFTECGENEIRIPFHVGENESRTWILTMSDEGLLFKHDHRYPDGTPEEMTDYGGWASEDGSEFEQYFPADEHTISLRDNLRSHIWKMELSEDGETFSYSLYLYEDLYFRADFDLTSTVGE